MVEEAAVAEGKGKKEEVGKEEIVKHIKGN